MFVMNLVKARRLRTECCSFRWLLLSVVIIAGIYQTAVLYYYLASTANNIYEPSLPYKNASHGMENVNGNHVKNDEHNSIPSNNNKKNKVDVIVYLAQFGDHSSYGAQVDAKQKAITGISKLNKSLELLYTNYVSQFPTDVIIFHDYGQPPDADTMTVLRHNRPHLQFRSLDETWWSLPYGLQYWEHFTWKRPAFSVGYRLMMRWFAVLIWFYLDAEGYTHCMRLDDDSYILSKIQYNLFDYMRDNNKRYAFRQPVYEGGGEEFDAVIDKYLGEYSGDNATSPSRELVDLYKQDRGVGFYNNFFIADVSFFLKPPASNLLRVIDESKLMFTHRTGDLVIQSAVVRLFLSPDQVHWFQDFTYEHMTLCSGRDKCGFAIYKGCPQNGGVSRGVGQYTDADWRKFATEEVRNRFKDNPKKCSLPITENFVGADDVRVCSRVQSRCGFYLKLMSGVNETMANSSWLQNMLREQEIMLNKTLP